MALDVWRQRYTQHKLNARGRGIPFLLTFEEWCWIWQHSGKWEQRGWHKGQYVMCRPGDRGAYEVGNVVIVLAEENRAERNRNYSLKGKQNPAYGQDYWANQAPDKREKRRESISLKLRGVPKSAAHRTAISEGRRAS